MSEEYTVEKIKDEMGWLEFAMEDPSMSKKDVKYCEDTIRLMQAALQSKGGGHYEAILNGFEDYEDMIYNRGEY